MDILKEDSSFKIHGHLRRGRVRQVSLLRPGSTAWIEVPDGAGCPILAPLGWVEPSPQAAVLLSASGNRPWKIARPVVPTTNFSIGLSASIMPSSALREPAKSAPGLHFSQQRLAADWAAKILVGVLHLISI